MLNTALFGRAKPFATQTWAKELDEKGRPIRNPGVDPTEEGGYVWPGVQGATNWYSPSYNPLTGLFYLTAWENKGFYRKGEGEYVAGNRFIGSAPKIDLDDDPGFGAIRALDPKTGDKAWEYKLHNKPLKNAPKPQNAQPRVEAAFADRELAQFPGDRTDGRSPSTER